MAALLIRRRRPIGEPAGDAATLEGTRGAGRIVGVLGELGLGVDLEGVRQLLVTADASAANIDALTLNARFATVVLGSHLINRPEPADRAASLRLAVRHLEPAGRLLIEHHPIDWAETAAEVRATPGGQLGMVDVRREPPFVSAVSVYDVGGRITRQPFRARVLSERELAEALADASLAFVARLSLTWLEAEHATRRQD
jgi:hypothetical protein